MTKIPSSITAKILTIGPDYINHRGGIGALIQVYSRYFEIFNFISSYKVGSGLSKLITYIRCLIKLNYFLLTNREIEIIHIHGASYGSFYRKFIIFIIGKYIYRKKTIYHIHGGEFQLFYTKSNLFIKPLISFLINKSDMVLCLSQAWYENYIKYFKPGRIEILPNVIDYPVIENQLLKDNNLTTYLFLGLICEAKGVFDLVNAISEKRDQFTGRMKLIIGGNGETEKIQKLIETCKVGEIVDFIGWVSGKEKTHLLTKSDVFILPSYNEGLPISILEAMSYGQAIIATKIGGIPELVSNKVNGLLIEPGNIIEIISSLEYFIENQGKINEYGAMSRKMVQRHFPESVLKQLSDIYNSLIDNE